MQYSKIIDGLEKFADGDAELTTALQTLKEKCGGEVFEPALSKDEIKTLLTDTEEGKLAFQSAYDSQFLRWERDKLPERLKAHYEERRAEDTKTDPKDDKLTELQKEIQDMKQRERKAILQSKATRFASEHGLPASLLADIVRGDDDTADSIMNTALAELNAWRDAQVQKAVSGIPSDTVGSKTPELPVNASDLDGDQLLDFIEKNPTYSGD